MPQFICTQATFGTPGCGAILTDAEREYYGTACEKCTTEDHERLKAWRAGTDDTELDERFDAKPDFSNRN